MPDKQIVAMSDRKNRRSRPRRKNGKKGQSRLPQTVKYNEMMYRTAWTTGALVSGTTGSIASCLSPSIQNSSEYSTLQALFTEVRLTAVHWIFTTLVPNSTTLNVSRLWVGYNNAFTDGSNTVPTSFTEVVNLQGSRVLNSAQLGPVNVRGAVPSSLEHSLITLDSPNPPTPWAGSPGMLVVYGDGFTNSTGYWRVSAVACFHLRGRH